MMSTSCSSSSASNQSNWAASQRMAVTVEKPADHQIGFLGATVPGAEAQAFQANVAVHRGGCFLANRQLAGGAFRRSRLGLVSLSQIAMRPDILNPLFAEVTALKGVGPGLAKPLDKLGLQRVDGCRVPFADGVHRPGAARRARYGGRRADHRDHAYARSIIRPAASPSAARRASMRSTQRAIT